jgi:malate dehydrogenase (oxaloacetate-decarboxylating)(NADP+)
LLFAEKQACLSDVIEGAQRLPYSYKDRENMSQQSRALAYHERGRPGKIEVVPTKPLATQRDLAIAYTPGVAEACIAIRDNPDDAYRYTAKGNLVAVITNGTAVLGLGNIGPLAGKPVMEGKANLFKKFADIDVFDLELNAPTVDEMVAAVRALAPTFGGINLEDIRAPECFEVERRLQAELDIPVFHDDQHGTAIICGAALINAVQLGERSLDKINVVFSGAGAAALACAQLFVSLGVERKRITMFDVDGMVTMDRTDLFPAKAVFAVERAACSLKEALVGADVFVGLSVGNVVTGDMIVGMAPNPVIFAMANPTPEIPYEVARATRPDAIVATGRSDYPNQVNNVLGFPFIFRAALDCRATRITPEMVIAATRALASLAREEVPENVLTAYGLPRLKFGPEYIIPKPFDPRVLTRVAPAVAEAAEASGVARAPIRDIEAYRESLHRFVERTRGIMQPLIARAKAQPLKPRIVFAEGADPQILRAAQICVDEKICIPVLLGTEARIRQAAEENNVALEGMEIEPLRARSADLATGLWERRARKGMTRAAAKQLMREPTWYGAMLVRMGLADGLVGGIRRPYKETIGPAIKVLGLKEGSRVVSGVYAMLFKDRRLFLGDCTVNIEPDAETLAEIAINTARVAETFGVEPRVAMLSYSDFGEHLHDRKVEVVRKAIELVKTRWPSLAIDGEMQADTAIDEHKMTVDFPFCSLKGAANVLVFPDLTSGNIAYKLLLKLGDAEALGPLVIGMGGPVGAIPLGASVKEIVNIVTYTVVQAIRRREQHLQE